LKLNTCDRRASIIWKRDAISYFNDLVISNSSIIYGSENRLVWYISKNKESDSTLNRTSIIECFNLEAESLCLIINSEYRSVLTDMRFILTHKDINLSIVPIVSVKTILVDWTTVCDLWQSPVHSESSLS